MDKKFVSYSGNEAKKSYVSINLGNYSKKK